MATHGTARPLKRRQPPLMWLLRRYHPGIVLLMGMATGFGVSLPQTFLRPYTAQLGLAGMALFFWVYTIVAFITRICIRRMPEKAGIRPMILIGIGSLATAMLCYLMVETRWQLLVPAFFTGVAHAMLFPAIVAAGSTAFPTRFRGLGTTLMLSMVDVGSLIGNPTVGGILELNAALGLPRYPVMFVVVAGLMLLVGGLYAVVTRGETAPEASKSLVRRRPRKRKADAAQEGCQRLPGWLVLAALAPRRAGVHFLESLTMPRILILSALLVYSFASPAQAQEPQTLLLWPQGAPGTLGRGRCRSSRRSRSGPRPRTKPPARRSSSAQAAATAIWRWGTKASTWRSGSTRWAFRPTC